MTKLTKAIEKVIYPYVSGAVLGFAMKTNNKWSEENQKFLERTVEDLAEKIVSSLGIDAKEVEKAYDNYYETIGREGESLVSYLKRSFDASIITCEEK